MNASIPAIQILKEQGLLLLSTARGNRNNAKPVKND